MKRRPARARRVALLLVACAARVLPPERAEWAAAMQAELHHVDRNRDALAWALGCVVTAFRQRMLPMHIGDLKVSRWVLVPEMALCFVPLTFFWWVTLFGDSGLIRLDADIVQRNFIGVPGGAAVLAALTFSGVLGVLGPIGLLAALRWIVLGRAIRSSVLAGALVAGPLVLGVIYVATLGARTGMLEAAGGLLLLFVLPAIGAAHLYHLGLRSADGRPDDSAGTWTQV